MVAWFRGRLSYANVVATLALVFAMSGGALAAGHYLLTSTRQISPRVLKELRAKSGAQGAAGVAGAQGPAGPQGPAGAQGSAGGKGVQGERGATGAQGPQGAPGAPGANGKDGSPWTAGGTLPSGSTETGTWAIGGSAGEGGTLYPTSVASFTIPLASEPTAQLIGPGEGEGEAKENLPAGCKGNHKEPKAEKGNLCVFETTQYNIAGLELGASTAGAIGRTEVTTSGEYYLAFGSWAVTAP